MTDCQPHEALALLRESQERMLRREGVPMVLTLVNEVGDDPETDQAARAEGARLAACMQTIWQGLAPTGRDGDMGRVVTVLQALSYADFRRGDVP